MESTTYVLVILGILAIVIIVLAIILYPQLREIVKELKRDS